MKMSPRGGEALFYFFVHSFLKKILSTSDFADINTCDVNLDKELASRMC